MTMTKTSVLLREDNRKVNVGYKEISHDDFEEELIEKWQNIIDIGAEILNVRAGLIMKITATHMEVFLKSSGERNPYPSNGKDTLGHGLYCETVIGTDKFLYIPNALSNKKWKDNPDMKINMVSYLGYPIKYPDGDFFGTICILDDNTMSFSKKHKEFMRILRDSIEKDLIIEEKRKQIEKLVTIDNLTNLNNKRALTNKLDEVEGNLQRNIGEYLITMLDIDYFKNVNDQFGHTAGDNVLVVLANILKKRVRRTDFIGRFGGDEFMIVSQQTEKEDFDSVMQLMAKEFNNHELISEYGVSFSYGIASSKNQKEISEVVNEADRLMYHDKTVKKANK